VFIVANAKACFVVTSVGFYFFIGFGDYFAVFIVANATACSVVQRSVCPNSLLHVVCYRCVPKLQFFPEGKKSELEFGCDLDKTDLSGLPEYQEKGNTAFKKLEPNLFTTIHYFWRPIKTINIKCLPAAPHF